MATWDRDGDGRIAADEIPHHYQITLGPRPPRRRSATPVRRHFRRPDDAPPPQPAAAGPNWFRRMDRNRDGDVSRREFRGPRAQFDRLDRDRDGLIDAAEAAAADRHRDAAPSRRREPAPRK